MPTLLRTVARTLVTSAVLAGPAAADDRPAPRRDGIVSLVERVKAAVVNIHSERTVTPGADDPFRLAPMQPQRVNGMGTGIVLDPRGYLVTNYHVIDDVQSLRVRLVDGTTCPARVLAADKESDLAVVKIDPPAPLPLVPLGTAADLMLAEKVIAVGNAYGYEHTVTVGHVSALKRDVTLNKEVSYKSLIQTQTPINPGNSGGPLFNQLGEVVGVNVAIRAGAQNIAFAIPVDSMIVRAADMLGGRSRGTRHGLTVADRHDRPADDRPCHRWAEVVRVESGSPAAAAGVKVGDVIERAGEVVVTTSIDVERAFLDRGQKPTPVTVKRAGESLTLTVQPLAAPAPPAVAPPTDVVWRKLGVKLVPVGAEAVATADKQLRGGMFVQDIAAGGAASRAGIQKGDILIGLHLWEAITADNVTYVLNHKDLATFAPLKAYFVRDGRIRDGFLMQMD